MRGDDGSRSFGCEGTKGMANIVPECKEACLANMWVADDSLRC